MASICKKHKTESVVRKTQTGCITYCVDCQREKIIKMADSIEAVLNYHGEHMEEWLYEKLKSCL
jgi:hypothetical protein